MQEYVGVRGFEPPTSCAQGRRSNRAEPHPEFLDLNLMYGKDEGKTTITLYGYDNSTAICGLAFILIIKYNFVKKERHNVTH